jgi:hypothetical protein
VIKIYVNQVWGSIIIEVESLAAADEFDWKMFESCTNKNSHSSWKQKFAVWLKEQILKMPETNLIEN